MNTTATSQPNTLATDDIAIGGMTCASCVARVERALNGYAAAYPLQPLQRRILPWLLRSLPSLPPGVARTLKRKIAP